MSLINQLQNTASIDYGGTPILSNTVSTVLLLPPTIIKSVDKLTANIGDTLAYTVIITNISLTALTNLPFSDTLPAGSTYVSDSFKVNNAAVTPTIQSDKLTYTIPNIPAAGEATITFQVKVVGGSI